MRQDEHAPCLDDTYIAAAMIKAAMEEKEKEEKEDVVNKPKHYISETGLETIDVIAAFTTDLTGVEAFCCGNAIKYLCRWTKKNGVEDLQKAIWYINKIISIRNGE